MRKSSRVTANSETDVTYTQFNRSRALRIAMRLVGILTWPIVFPLALLSKASDILFVTCSQAVAIVPYALGEIVRYEFYRMALDHVGENVMIGFGTVMHYRNISIGDNVLIGMYNSIHHCDFGSYVLTAEGCRFLSGPSYHNFDRLDIPMALQGGRLRRITIGDDVWIGADSIVMNHVGHGAVIGAGSVVRKPAMALAVSAGNPCRFVRKRSESEARHQEDPVANVHREAAARFRHRKSQPVSRPRTPEPVATQTNGRR